MQACVLITNWWVACTDTDWQVTEIRLESLLPRSISGPDFIITVDGGGYNAGIWLLRRSKWSEDFLKRWWDMKDYVRVLFEPSLPQPMHAGQ